jgi:hypothetical protein
MDTDLEMRTRKEPPECLYVILNEMRVIIYEKREGMELEKT